MAYDLMKKCATTPCRHAGRDVANWIKYGYIPYDNDKDGSCTTQALSYDDFVLGTLAGMLNHTKDMELFLNRSKNYINVWNSEYNFFCPKDKTGKWECPPIWIDVFDSRYVEGDAWHYRWFVPGDIEGLVVLFGSNESYIAQLDYFMWASRFDPYNVLPNPYYWAGNEPDILTPFLFNWGGRADLTQKYVREVMDYSFTLMPDGLPGNDDFGTMSAWFCWSALGLYPVSGTTKYAVASPIFQKITLHRSVGDLTIIAHNVSDSSRYVSKLTVNGILIDMKNNPFVDHSQIKSKATLIFWMSTQPKS